MRPPLSRLESVTLDRFCYQNTLHLAGLLRELDRPRSWDLTVILIVPRGIKCSLPRLIERVHHAARLILSAPGAGLPGTVSIGDLALHSHALGWGLVEFEHDAQRAIRNALEFRRPDDRLVVLQPAPGHDEHDAEVR